MLSMLVEEKRENARTGKEKEYKDMRQELGQKIC